MALIFYLFMRANDCNVLLLLLLINEMYLNFEEKHFMLLFLCFSFLFYFMQDIIRPVENPIKKTGHIQILYVKFGLPNSENRQIGTRAWWTRVLICQIFKNLCLIFCFVFL